MSRAFVVAAAVFFVVACSPAPSSSDGGQEGGGAGGGGGPDVDAGTEETSRPDGGVDSGVADAGILDSGVADGGADAGAPDGGPSCSLDAGREDAGGYVPLTIANDTPSAYGNFDPSLWYEADGGGGFLTYSAVPAQNQLHTRIAYSNDRGATWTYLGNVNQPTPVTITTTDSSVCGATTCTGTWVHETSSIVYDAADPNPARRFKVFVHSYFATASAIHYLIGVVTMFTTAFPGPGAVWVETRILGWNSSSPESSTNVGQNINTDPALAPYIGSCLLLSEPGALVRGGTIDVAFGCVRFVPNAGAQIDIQLLRSTDHGSSWTFVSTLLRAQEAALFGTTGTNAPAFNGADLFERNGRTFLFVSPNGPVQGVGDGYRGCLVFELNDVDAGAVERCGGAPIPKKKFLGPQTYFTGACTWAAGASANNTVVPIANLPFGTYFQMFSMPTEDPL